METKLLQIDKNCATVDGNTAPSPQGHVWVSRADLEDEHMMLIRRLHTLRKLLGYPPLLTGKKRREQR